MASYSLPGLLSEKRGLGLSANLRTGVYFRDRVAGQKGKNQGLATYRSFTFLLAIRRKGRRLARTKNK